MAFWIMSITLATVIQGAISTQRMIADIEAGKVKYVITKDIFRFDRDYITVADLLDRVTVWLDGRMEVSLKFLNELPISVGVELGKEAAE